MFEFPDFEKAFFRALGAFIVLVVLLAWTCFTLHRRDEEIRDLKADSESLCAADRLASQRRRRRRHIPPEASRRSRESRESLNMPPISRYPDVEVIPNFMASEFSCKCGGTCHGGLLTMRLLVSLDALRRRWGKPLRITSGLRCPHHNRAVGGTRDSLHIYGQAVDLAGEGIHSVEFFVAAMWARFGGFGQGEWKKDDGSIVRILHLDVRKIEANQPPTIWSYTKSGRVPGNAMIEDAWALFKEDSCG